MCARKVKRFDSAVAAQSFDKFSVANSVALDAAAALRGCTCQAYRDWFTVPRWNAQNFVVRRGEKGTPITVMVNKAGEDKDGNPVLKTYPKIAYVFCRCQVVAMKENVDERQFA